MNYRSRRGRIAVGLIGTTLAVTATVTAARVASAEPVLSSATSSSATASLKYDSKTLFRGVFFGHGPAAKMISKYIASPPETQATTAAENKIMAAVERSNPGTIQGFADAVASGSHVATEQALLRSSDRVQAAVLRLYGTDVTQADPSRQGIVAAVVVAVAVYVWKYVKKYSYAPSENSSGLQMDGLVHTLVTQAK